MLPQKGKHLVNIDRRLYSLSGMFGAVQQTGIQKIGVAGPLQDAENWIGGKTQLTTHCQPEWLSEKEPVFQLICHCLSLRQHNQRYLTANMISHLCVWWSIMYLRLLSSPSCKQQSIAIYRKRFLFTQMSVYFEAPQNAGYTISSVLLGTSVAPQGGAQWKTEESTGVVSITLFMQSSFTGWQFHSQAHSFFNELKMSMHSSDSILGDCASQMTWYFHRTTVRQGRIWYFWGWRVWSWLFGG